MYFRNERLPKTQLDKFLKSVVSITLGKPTW